MKNPRQSILGLNIASLGASCAGYRVLANIYVQRILLILFAPLLSWLICGFELRF